jgi:dienelactone hydrolase
MIREFVRSRVPERAALLTCEASYLRSGVWLLLAGFAVAALLAAAATPASGQGREALLGGLEPGPHAIGYRVVSFSDPSRPTGPKTGTDGRPVTADRARPLWIHVWYPAASSGAPAMTIADYMKAADGTQSPGAFAAEHRQALPRTVGITLSDPEWAQYQALPLAALRDAPVAAGAFPLLIGMLRPVSVAAMNEYLASHGYVVAMVQRQPREAVAAEGLVLEALVMSQHIRDMEMAIGRMRSEPFVDPVRLGAFGFSGDGLAQLVLAMRHPDVDAVSQLETGYYAPIGTSSYQEVTAYDPAALRVPMLFAYSENLGRNTDLQMAEIDRMRYAPRYFLYLGEPRMTHWDFATEGIALAAALNRRPEARAGVVRAYQAAQRYQLTFFDAFVRRDAAARERLATPPAPAGPGPLIEIRQRPAVVPAVARAEFRALVDRDMPRAMQVAREGLPRDPAAAVFEEGWLNALGYELLQRGQGDKSLEVFRLLVDAHPASANALDSLSEALETLGQRSEALQVAEKGLAALPADRSIPAADRKGIEDGLRARIGRLRPR